MPGAVVIPPECVRAARGRLDEDQDPPLRVVRRELLDEGSDRRRDLRAAEGEDPAFDLLEPGGGEAGPPQDREAVLVPVLGDAADHVAAAEILQVVGERGERRHHLLDVGDVLLPLGLLVLPARERIEIDGIGHDTTTFLAAPINRAHSSRRPDSAASTPRSIGVRSLPWKYTRPARQAFRSRRRSSSWWGR